MASTPFQLHYAEGNHARFAAAHAARSLGWGTTDLLLAWHLHATLGLSGFTVSMLLTLFLSVGALSNHAVGYWLTAARATGPAYVRLQLAASIATAVLLAGQFLVRDAVAVTIIGIAFRIAFAAQDVPQSALISLLPVGGEDVKRYARLRVMLSGMTRIVAIALHLALLQIDRSWANILAFAVIGGLIVASAFGLRGLNFPVATAHRSVTSVVPASWPEGLSHLLVAFGISAALLPTLSRLLIFMPPEETAVANVGSWMLGAFCCGSVAGPLVQRCLALKLGDRNALPASIFLVVTSAVIVTFANAVSVRIAAIMLHGIGLSAIGVLLWSSAANIAIRDAASGIRRDGLVASAVILTTHLSMAFGALLLAPLIETYQAGDASAALAALLVVGGGTVGIMAVAVRQRTTPEAA